MSGEELFGLVLFANHPQFKKQEPDYRLCFFFPTTLGKTGMPTDFPNTMYY